MHWTALKNLVIVAFFGLQLAAAVPGFVWDKHQTRGNFSWNMYSTRHPCRERYMLFTRDGREIPLEYDEAFNRPGRAHTVLHRDTLPEFHEYMCREIGAAGDLREIRAQVECKIDNEPPVVLVDRSVDICTAPNYGVR